MAGEKNGLVEAQAYNAADLGGDYSQVAKGLGAWSVRLENPDDFKPALATALKANAEGKPALIEIVAKQNFKYSRY
jgi:thiamine pyrophosphate-dependent acetolactate synthase large subunit-like protein